MSSSFMELASDYYTLIDHHDSSNSAMGSTAGSFEEADLSS